MRQPPKPRPTGVAAVPAPSKAGAVPTAPSLGGVRVLQNRAAPAQRSLFQRA